MKLLQIRSNEILMTPKGTLPRGEVFLKRWPHRKEESKQSENNHRGFRLAGVKVQSIVQIILYR